MSSLSFETHAPARSESWIRRLPVIGPIARELAEGDADFPLFLILALVSAWGCAFMIWGLPALVLPALAAVPVVFLALVTITRG